MNISHPKDLSQKPPRSPKTLVHDYAILGRTIDKCRAHLAGTPGDYHFDCPLDNMLFSFKGITGKDFRARVEAAATDEDVAFWLDQTGTARTPQEVREWSATVRGYKPQNNPEKKEWFEGECRRLGLDPKTTTLFDYLEADDTAVKAGRE